MSIEVLPALREDLGLYPAPADRSGAPTWSLHDPARNLFFRIDWHTFEFLARWSLRDPRHVLEAIQRETTLEARPDDLVGIIQFLADNELLQRSTPAGTHGLLTAAHARRQSWRQWLLHNYLFFRIPLLRPDRWLSRSLPLVRAFFTPAFLWISLGALLLGLFELTRQWDVLVTSIVDTFSLDGLIGYGATLLLVKTAHELGHAWTAKRYGCRVPTMGIAFLVMFPMAYTDVNDAWKLPSRNQRLAVGAAGIATELVIAAWSTLAWTLLPDGVLRNATLLLATTTWISTLLVNASPFMRFDGYFLLSDWLDVPNLHARAFALCRWWMRERLFDLGGATPECLGRPMQRFLLAFGYITWLYRLVVFAGIAALVYHWFPKPLGPALAAIEVGWFITLPIVAEVHQWTKLWPHLRLRRRTWISIAILLAAAGLACLPWDPRVHAEAMLRPHRSLPIVAPDSARLAALPVLDRQDVAQGATLLVLESDDVDVRRDTAEARASRLEWQASAAGVMPKLREQREIVLDEIGRVQAELRGVRDEESKNRPAAPFAGRFFLASPDLTAGSWVGRNQRIGILVDLSRWKVDTYLPDTAVGRVRVGDRAFFVAEAGGGGVALQVTAVDRDATRSLSDAMLAAPHGGTLLVRERHGQVVPIQALYHVTLAPTGPYDPPHPSEVRGHLVVFGSPVAPFAELARQVAAVLRREAGF